MGISAFITISKDEEVVLELYQDNYHTYCSIGRIMASKRDDRCDDATGAILIES